MFEIYTDGACRGNGKENAYGGYAFVILKDGEKVAERSGNRKGATNQQMELRAAIEALTYFEEVVADSFSECTLYSDSAYLINCKTQGWYKNWELNGWKTSVGTSVTNQVYWKRLIPYFESGRIKFRKVRGHSGQKDWNDYVDKLATAAADGKCVGE